MASSKPIKNEDALVVTYYVAGQKKTQVHLAKTLEDAQQFARGLASGLFTIIQWEYQGKSWYTSPVNTSPVVDEPVKVEVVGYPWVRFAEGGTLPGFATKATAEKGGWSKVGEGSEVIHIPKGNEVYPNGFADELKVRELEEQVAQLKTELVKQIDEVAKPQFAPSIKEYTPYIFVETANNFNGKFANILTYDLDDNKEFYLRSLIHASKYDIEKRVVDMLKDSPTVKTLVVESNQGGQYLGITLAKIAKDANVELKLVNRISKK